MSEPEHFSFNPLRIRLGFLGCALVAALAANFAFRGVLRGEGVQAFVRTGMCVGLAAASVTMALRLRPRRGFGVRADEEGLEVSRLLGGPPLRLPWEQVEFARPMGSHRREIVIFFGAEKPLILTRQLFGSEADFHALTRALERRVPPPRFDA